jgi:hypothetical protein
VTCERRTFMVHFSAYCVEKGLGRAEVGTICEQFIEDR